MSPALSSAVLGLCESLINFGCCSIVGWAMWTGQLRRGPYIAACAVAAVAAVALTLRLCGVRP